MKKLLLNSFFLLCALIVGTSAWATDPITIWSENFNGLSENATPTAPTISAYTGVTYTCTNGAGTSPGATKIMNDKLATGASAPEMMVGKKGSGTGAAGGKFTAVIPLNNFEGTLTLTYYQNKQSLKVSSTTTGVSGGQTLKPSSEGQQTTTFTGITTAMTSITIVFEATTTNNVRLDDIVLTGYKASSISAPTFLPAGGVFTSSQNVTLSCATDGATIYYTTDESTPTSSSTQYTGAIAVNSTTTIKAIAKKGDDYSSVSTATYAILAHAGTEADPFTVTDARNALTLDVINAETDYYVTGYVAKKNDIASGQMTYWISDDGTMTNNIQCYKGKSVGGVDFTDSNAPEVGDLAVVKGKLLIYQSTTYEFAENNEVVSITPQSTITTTKTSINNITYEYGNGPSTAQTFSVAGTNLTADITLSLGGSSNYEISTTENSGYTNSLTLTQTAGTVAATVIYVRLKEGLSINASYEGSVTLTSTGAINKTVTLSGSVTNPSYTFDLSTDNTAAATTTAMTWIGTPAVMGVAKGSAGTATNNYYPGTTGQNYTSTRLYKNCVLTITPISGYTISSVVFEATTVGYANALQASSWSNATAAVSDQTVTVTPTTGTSAISATIGGTCGLTSVKVYYTGTTGATETISLNVNCTDGAKYYGTYSTSKAFVVPTDLTVSEISVITGQLVVEEYNAGAIVPANTGIMVSAATSGDHGVFIASGGTSVLGSDNMLMPSGDTGISAANMDEADTKFYRLTMHNGTQLGFWWGAAAGAAFDLAAHKAYLAIPNTAMSANEFVWFGNDDVTAIESVNRETITNNQFFDLQGRKVVQPTKGLYIVNGKKVVIK